MSRFWYELSVLGLVRRAPNHRILRQRQLQFLVRTPLILGRRRNAMEVRIVACRRPKRNGLGQPRAGLARMTLVTGARKKFIGSTTVPQERQQGNSQWPSHPEGG